MRSNLLMSLAVGLAGMGLALTACTETLLGPETTAVVPDAHLASPTFGLDTIQSVFGSGHLVDGAIERTVTFNIIKLADGTVAGWYHSLRRGRGGSHIRVRVECLHVAGNRAWATGVVVAAHNPDFIGLPYSVCFVDNGEGAGAAPDEIGTASLEYHDCMTEPEIPSRQITIGNLVISG